MNNKEIKVLKLFNEKVDRLSSRSFLTKLDGSGVSFEAKKLNESEPELKVERKGPDEESIDAFVTTFRLFIQDNDRLSLQNVSKLYSNPSISKDLKDEYKRVRQKINNYLNSEISLFNFNGKKYTYREILEIYIYGGISHTNEAKTEQYKALMSHIIAKNFFDNEFVNVLANLYEALAYIKILNEKAINQLLGL